jgi:hypothetical protein
MANQIKRTISISPESDYEIHRLAKMWGIPVSQARERCYHFAAAQLRRVSPHDKPMQQESELRQAEAKVELLKQSSQW